MNKHSVLLFLLPPIARSYFSSLENENGYTSPCRVALFSKIIPSLIFGCVLYCYVSNKVRTPSPFLDDMGSVGVFSSFPYERSQRVIL